MKRPRRKARRAGPRKKTASAAAAAKVKRARRPKAPAAANPTPRALPPRGGEQAGPGGPTLRSQAQLEIRLERGARALTATEQAARLASAQMERRIGRLLSRRVKLKFKS